MAASPADSVQYAQMSGGVVVVRVLGRGNHQNSPDLRKVFELTSNSVPPPSYVIDMEHCTALDSTFMGTMASIAMHQRQAGAPPMVVTNVRSHVRYLLKTLGLHYILELHQGQQEGVDPPAEGQVFKPAQTPQLSPMERIVMMIEAHETLVELDGENKVRFKGVLESLEDSLERARQQQQDSKKKNDSKG